MRLSCLRSVAALWLAALQSASSQSSWCNRANPHRCDGVKHVLEQVTPDTHVPLCEEGPRLSICLARPTMADVDDDGRPELLVLQPTVASRAIGVFRWHPENGTLERAYPLGDARNPFFGASWESQNCSRPYDIEAADWDGDGDKDLIVGCENGQVLFYEKANTSLFMLRTGPDNPFGGISGGAVSAGDWDGDGDVDLAVILPYFLRQDAREHGRSYLHYFERVEPNRLIERTGSNNPFASITDGTDDLDDVVMADWDHDGDVDLILQEEQQGQYNGAVLYFQRQDEGNLVRKWGVDNPFESVGGIRQRIGNDKTSISVVDWDQDGDLDLISGTRYFSRSAVRDWVERIGPANPLATCIQAPTVYTNGRYSQRPTVHPHVLHVADWDGDERPG